MPRLFKRKRSVPFGSELFLAAFEGLEGGFAIGAGVVAGLSFTDLDRHVLIASAIISIIVNGFNSASVKYSSAHYIDELDGRETRYPFKNYFVPAFIHFMSYFIISFISLIPLFLMRDMPNAILYSCILTIVILLFAGYWRAKLLGAHRWRDGLELAALGAGIILVGYTTGWLVHAILGA